MANKIKSLAVLIGAVIAAFLITNLIHFRYFPVHVVLYDSLLDVALGTLAVALVFYGLRAKKSPLTGCESGLALTVAALCGVTYAVMVPTVIDRSLSIYILEKLDQRGGRIAMSAWDEILKKEFFPEHRLVDIRLTEQVDSGTITISGNCVSLTPRGQFVASLTKLYRKNILPKHREIMGEFTDDLTDPFRNSKVVVPYDCP